ncbi:MAG: sulfatase [Cytophagales bacterium]|nr:sulfatase [Cytophagales bacterium]
MSKILILLLFSYALAYNSKAENPSKTSPNMLIIMADDCTYSDLPLYGGVNVKTPQIDKLATEGITFNKAYVTMSMCVPCRAELYTGMQPARNGVCWNHSIARTGLKSIVQHLGDFGYRTGIAGKIHAKPKDVFPFELVDGVERDCVSETAKYDKEGLRAFMVKDREQPFCLITALVVPHIPWTVGDPSHFDPDNLALPPYLADTKETREEFTRYLAEIEVLDQQVGATLRLLEEEGIEDNTIVIFTSEQGAQFPFCKWTNWDNGVHTGFIVRWPGKIKANTRTDALIQYADVLPTLLEAVGGEAYDGMDGSSFLQVLHGTKETHRDFAYFVHNNVPEGPSYPIRSVTDGKYHYIRNLSSDKLYIEKHLMGRMPINPYWDSWIFESTNNEQTLDLVTRYMNRPPQELYDTRNDPNELENLIDDEKLKGVKRKLSAALDRWMASQGDPGAEIDSFEALNKARKGDHFTIH